MRNELNEKISEMGQLEMGLNRVEGEDAFDVGSLKRVIASLEKENTVLRVQHFFLLRCPPFWVEHAFCILKCLFCHFCTSNNFFFVRINYADREE